MLSSRSARPGSASLVFLCLLIATCRSVPELIRGPYLQGATPTSMVVRWRTAGETRGWIRFGTDLAKLDRKLIDAEATRDHVFELPDLEPGTLHHYEVGSADRALTDADHGPAFRTPPLAGTSAPVRMWVIGDSGHPGEELREVRDAYLHHVGKQQTDLWLMLGDNAYYEGSDEEYQRAVFDSFPSLLPRTPLWPTFGNHDARQASSRTETGPYYELFSLPRHGEAGGVPSGTEAYYSFDHANVHFVCLDSQGSDREPQGAMLTWLEKDLAATRQKWIVAFWHHSPYTRGSYDSDTDSKLTEMRANALPILEAHDVDLVLTGHSHSYERSALMAGHYGASETLTDAMLLDPSMHGPYRKQLRQPGVAQGTVYAVVGTSSRAKKGPLDHPAMRVSLAELGSLVIEIDGPQLQASFLDGQGEIRDHFSILKN